MSRSTIVTTKSPVLSFYFLVFNIIEAVCNIFQTSVYIFFTLSIFYLMQSAVKYITNWLLFFFSANMVEKHIALHILIVTCRNVTTCVHYRISAHLFFRSIFTSLIWFKISNICMWAWNIA